MSWRVDLHSGKGRDEGEHVLPPKHTYLSQHLRGNAFHLQCLSEDTREAQVTKESSKL